MGQEKEYVPFHHPRRLGTVLMIAYRVHVYNLYSTGTIEDNMALMHHKKQEIANNVCPLSSSFGFRRITDWR